jgi:subtilase family serine protease
MEVYRRLPPVTSCFAAVALCSISMLVVPMAGAQSSSVLPRINQQVNESSLTTLRGNISSLARPQYDRGEATPSTQLTHVRVVLSRSPEQEAALEEFMAQQVEKASPNYHKWLTPDQLGKQYGPADSDITAIVAWLESHGLHVDPVSPARTNISFSGSVSQIEEALHTAIHAFERNGQQFYANTSEPKIPSALASVVNGFAHLSTYKPRPYNVPGLPGMADRQLNRLLPTAGMAVRPELTVGTAPNNSLYVVPGDAATIYDTPNSFNANFSSGTSYTGSGVTIGIGGDATIQASTVADYRTRFLGNSTAPIITNVSTDPATSTNDTDEAYLDNEIAGGLAPGATIHFYTAASLDVAIEQALTDNTVDIFSLSFGLCEYMLSTSDNALISSWWQQAASQGIPVLVSTGDSGSAGCDNDNTEVAAAHGLAVSGWATTPYNIAVGGTDLYGLLSGFPQYVSTTNGTNYRSALKYIPESTWNDSTSLDTTISANVPRMNSGKTNIVAGGGGASSCSTNTVNPQKQVTCVSGYPKPTWQHGTGVPNDSVRDIPDISLMAGNGVDAAAWLVCTDDTGTVNNTTVTANCTTQSDGNFYFYGFGGTSTAAPAFAGILALVQQKVGSRLGMAANTLYDLYNSANASAIFHDVTVGNNSVYCTAGTPNCSLNTAGYPFLTGYSTNAGYDLATGLGSVDATQLINYWTSATGSGSATVTVSPASPTITVVQPLSVPVTVTGGSLGTPTGTVTLTSSGYSSGAQSLASGAYTFTVPADTLPVGTDKLTATYSGDLNYSAGTGSASVTVTLTTPTATTGAATSITATTATIAGSANPDGGDTRIVFAYGTSSTLSGATTTASSDIGSGVTAVGVSVPLTGLTAGTKYYYQIQATNSAGNTSGAINSFTTASLLPIAYQFIPVTPCRIADTRYGSGAFGGPELAGGSTRTFNIPQSSCSIPATAVAYSLNVTVVPNGSLNYLTIWPAGQAQPYVSTLNSDGRVKANATITPAGTNGGVSVYVTDATQVILDIGGYFVPAGASSSGLQFFPLAPCRIADTRWGSGSLGGPSLTGGVARSFPILSSSCGIPGAAQAYSLNITALPHGTLGYLTTWPTGQSQPTVSTLNSSTGTVTANAAIVPAGSGGNISTFVSDSADVILDINGYFAPPASGGLSLYSVTPCRVLDTRSSSGAFKGTLAVSVDGSSCAPPATAQAYVLNATVVPPGTLGYLTLWPDGGAQPYVSTLNSYDGAITSNMAVVPTTNGKIDAFSSDLTHLILDISSYFAP